MLKFFMDFKSCEKSQFGKVASGDHNGRCKSDQGAQPIVNDQYEAPALQEPWSIAAP